MLQCLLQLCDRRTLHYRHDAPHFSGQPEPKPEPKPETYPELETIFALGSFVAVVLEVVSLYPLMWSYIHSLLHGVR